MVQLLQQPGAGSNGSSVTNANCTSGNQWDVVTKSGTGTTITFDNAHTIHSLATVHKIHYATVASTANIQWKASLTATANAYARGYYYLTANPSVNVRLLAFLSGSASACASVLLLTTGAVRLLNSAGATVATTTATIPLNAWFRLEFDVTGISGSTGNVALRIYSGATLETNTPDTNGSISGSGVSVTGTMNDVRFGTTVGTTESTALDMWLADMAWSDTSNPGPAVVNLALTTVAATASSTAAVPTVAATADLAATTVAATASSAATVPTDAVASGVAVTTVAATASGAAAIPTASVGSALAETTVAATGTAAAATPTVAVGSALAETTVAATATAAALPVTVDVQAPADLSLTIPAASATAAAGAPTVTTTSALSLATLTATATANALAVLLDAPANLALTTAAATSSALALPPLLTFFNPADAPHDVDIAGPHGRLVTVAGPAAHAVTTRGPIDRGDITGPAGHAVEVEGPEPHQLATTGPIGV